MTCRELRLTAFLLFSTAMTKPMMGAPIVYDFVFSATQVTQESHIQITALGFVPPQTSSPQQITAVSPPPFPGALISLWGTDANSGWYFHYISLPPSSTTVRLDVGGFPNQLGVYNVSYQAVGTGSDTGSAIVTISDHGVPEPGAMGLVTMGLVFSGALLARRRRGRPGLGNDGDGGAKCK